jgi:hypothetical protein
VVLTVATSNMEQHDRPAPAPSPQELQWLSDRAAACRVPPGTSFTIDPPPSLANRLAHVPVDAVRLADGRIAILLKIAIGAKENFRGFLYLSGALAPSEVKNDGRGRRFVSLPAPPPWEELYLLNTRGEQLSEVFFDLN